MRRWVRIVFLYSSNDCAFFCRLEERFERSAGGVELFMKVLNVCLIALLVSGCLATAHAGQSAGDALQTFTGEIMDDLCAKNKSHEQMMEQMKSMSRDPAVCTRKCVELGAHYVLYDRQKDVVYKI